MTERAVPRAHAGGMRMTIRRARFLILLVATAGLGLAAAASSPETTSAAR